MKKSVVWALSMSLLLAACSEKHLETSVPGADLITGISGSIDVPGVTMTLTPPTLRTCEHPSGRMVAKVSWDVRAAGATSVTIWVSDASSDEKRFFHGGPVGSVDTGPWAGDGLILRLEDGDKTGRTLAIRTLHAVRCLAGLSGTESDQGHSH